MSKDNPQSSLPTTISTETRETFTQFALAYLEAVRRDDDNHKAMVINNATQALLAAFEKHLPEKRATLTDTLALSDKDSVIEACNKGYNQAITDITQLIKENKENV